MCTCSEDFLIMQIIENMVRVDECFKCGITEKDAKLIYDPNKPVLCEKCSKM